MLQSLIVSWLHTRQPSPDAYQVLTQAVEALDLEFLRWQLMSIDLTEQTLTTGGTADPGRHIYRLLPEVLAARIEKLPAYEYCGRQVTFRRVATADGAELMSWPRPRRGHLARAAGGDQVLCCHLLYQTEPVRDALIDAAEQSLDLVGYRVVAPEGTWGWQTPELEVRIHARELGVHGGPLGAGIPPRRGGQTQQAIEDRRRNVRDFVAGLPGDSRVVFVELDGKKAFRRRTTDPKFAIRLGCADAGRVSQFITPERSAGEGQEADAQEADKEESTLEHRAAAAWFAVCHGRNATGSLRWRSTAGPNHKV